MGDDVSDNDLNLNRETYRYDVTVSEIKHKDKSSEEQRGTFRIEPSKINSLDKEVYLLIADDIWKGTISFHLSYDEAKELADAINFVAEYFHKD